MKQSGPAAALTASVPLILTAAAFATSVLAGVPLPALFISAGGAFLYAVYGEIAENDRLRSADYIQTGEAAAAAASFFIGTLAFPSSFLIPFSISAVTAVAVAFLLRLLASGRGGAGIAAGAAINASILVILAYLARFDGEFDIGGFIRPLSGWLVSEGLSTGAGAAICGVSALALAAAVPLSGRLKLYSHGDHYVRAYSRLRRAGTFLFPVRGIITACVVALIGVHGCGVLYARRLFPSHPRIASTAAVLIFLNLLLIGGPHVPDYAMPLLCVVVSYGLYFFQSRSRMDYYDRM